jgi:hypothetical protein
MRNREAKVCNVLWAIYSLVLGVLRPGSPALWLSASFLSPVQPGSIAESLPLLQFQIFYNIHTTPLRRKSKLIGGDR